MFLKIQPTCADSPYYSVTEMLKWELQKYCVSPVEMLHVADTAVKIWSFKSNDIPALKKQYHLCTGINDRRGVAKEMGGL